MSPIIEVQAWLVGPEYATQVYISEKAMKAIEKHCEDIVAYAGKIQHFAEAGLPRFEGAENAAIRSERGGVFRIRHKRSSLFRLIGFYNGPDKVEFIALDGFKKPGDNYTPGQWERIRNASVVREKNLWRKARP